MTRWAKGAFPTPGPLSHVPLIKSVGHWDRTRPQAAWRNQGTLGTKGWTQRDKWDRTRLVVKATGTSGDDTCKSLTGRQDFLLAENVPDRERPFPQKLAINLHAHSTYGAQTYIDNKRKLLIRRGLRKSRVPRTPTVSGFAYRVCFLTLDLSTR
jgi:hypothetical protein